jgi:hypothetical protein
MDTVLHSAGTARLAYVQRAAALLLKWFEFKHAVKGILAPPAAAVNEQGPRLPKQRLVN